MTCCVVTAYSSESTISNTVIAKVGPLYQTQGIHPASGKSSLEHPEHTQGRRITYFQRARQKMYRLHSDEATSSQTRTERYGAPPALLPSHSIGRFVRNH